MEPRDESTPGEVGEKAIRRRSKAVVFDAKARAEYLSGFDNKKKLMKLAKVEKKRKIEQEHKKDKRRQRRQRLRQAVVEVLGEGQQEASTRSMIRTEEIIDGPSLQKSGGPLQETTVVIETIQ